MKRKSILLYKTPKGFTRFIKIRFLKKYNFDYHKDNEIVNFKGREYFMAFIHIETIEDLVAFASIYAHIEKVHIMSNSAKIIELLSQFNDITILHSELLREDILKLIDNNIKSILQEEVFSSVNE